METITRWSGYRADVDQCVRSTVHATDGGVTLCGVLPRNNLPESFWSKDGLQVSCERCRKAMQKKLAAPHKRSA
jgi:hypothetical protein